MDRYDQAALRLADGWWHRPCWLQGSQERQEALRSQREHVGRHEALARYLLAQDRWGGLPAVLAVNLVGSRVGADNHALRQHRINQGRKGTARFSSLRHRPLPLETATTQPPQIS